MAYLLISQRNVVLAKQIQHILFCAVLRQICCSPKKSGRCDTRRSPVALFVPEIWPEIPKNTEIQESRNPKILFLVENLKSLKIQK